MKRVTGIIVSLCVFAFAFSACGDGEELLCEPQLYQCGGDNGMIVQRCDSRGVRWETLTDCSEFDEVCVEGECVEAAD